jgi:hypothetical protein
MTKNKNNGFINFPFPKWERERVRGREWTKKIPEVVPPHPVPFSPMGRREIAEV